MDKKIVLFFGKKREGPDPFWDFKEKRSVYYKYFKEGFTRGISMFLANGKESHYKDLKFQNTLFFDGSGFIPHEGTLIADAIFDRSATLTFPTEPISKKTLNPHSFKKFCSSKINMHKKLHSFMPKTLIIQKTDAFKKICGTLKTKEDVYVLKPSNGLGGKGIVMGTPQELNKYPLDTSKEYVLQEFVDTSCGVPEITNGRHDLRFVFVHNVLTWITLRKPKGDALLANVSQGGSIQDITYRHIPSAALRFVDEVQKTIQTSFGDDLLYSIDIGFQKKTPYLFEINDQIGFPAETMAARNQFINAILYQLNILSKK